MDENLEGWIRVSDILKMMPTFDKESKSWDFPMNKIPKDKLDAKAALGVEVHAAIESHGKEDFYVLNDKETPYFKSYLVWQTNISPIHVIAEHRFKNEQLKLTGKIDLIAYLGGTSPLIIDFKNTVYADHMKWPIQGALYYFLARESYPNLAAKALFVQLDKEGGDPKTYEYTITNELLKSAISLYNSYLYLTKML